MDPSSIAADPLEQKMPSCSYPRSVAAVVLAILSLTLPTAAAADPIPLTPFQATVSVFPNWPSGPAHIQLNGPAVTFWGETSREVQPGRMLSPCYPRLCTLGTYIDFSYTTGSLGFDASALDGTLQVDGERLRLSYLAATFTIDGAPVLLPSTVNGTARVSTAVDVAAAIRASVEGGPDVDLTLAGSGTAHLLLRRPIEDGCGPNCYPSSWLDEVTIEFASPTPVPEPATLALVGMGLLGTRWMARRRTRHPANR